MSDGALSAGTVSLAVKPDTAGFAGELKSKILGGVSGVGEGMGGAILGGLKSMAGPIAAVAAGFGIAHIVEDSTKAFEDLAGSVKTMQRISSGSVEEVSGLAGAMKLAGVNADNVTGAITIFSKKLGAAGQDAKATAAMNNLFGESIKDANGHVKSMAELLPGIADKFKELPNGAEKTALATQLFGRAGAQMIPVLNQGSEGIAELTAKAKEMGLTLDDTAMNSFTESRKAQREFQATMQGLSVTLGQAFLPVLEAVQNAFRDFLIPLIMKATAFVKEHQAQFEALAATIKGILQPIVEGLINIIKDLTTWVLQNKDMLTALTVAVLAGVIAFNAYNAITTAITVAQKGWLALQAIFKVVTGEATLAQMGFNAALIANPIGLIIAAIAALVAGLIWFFTQTKLGQSIWKSFTEFMTSSMKAVGSFFASAWEGIQSAFSTVIGFLDSSFRAWGNSVIGVINTVISGANAALSLISKVTGGAINVSIPKIPKLAEGGIIPATPGGRLVRVAEAGQAEAVIPLSKLGSVGGGSGATINYYAAPNDSISAEAKLVAAVQRAKVLGAL